MSSELPELEEDFQLPEEIRVLQDDIVLFTNALWSDLGLLKFAPLKEIEHDILRYIAGDGLDLNEYRRRGVLAPRGMGKTYFIATFAVWRLFRDPTEVIIILSKKETHAVQTVKMIRDWISFHPLLKHLQPDPSRGHRDNYLSFDCGCLQKLSRSPSLSAYGIEGMITGSRASLLIPDDIETPENTKTVGARERLDYTTNEFTEIASWGRREIVGVGTYHHEKSVYLSLAKKGYKFRTYPIAYPQRDDIFMNLAPIITRKLDSGEAEYTTDENYELNPTMPHRFGLQEIVDKKAGGRRYFAMQNMLVSNLQNNDRYKLRLEDLIVPDFEMPSHEAPVSIKWGKTDRNGNDTRREDIDVAGFASDRIRRQAFIESSLTAPLAPIRMTIDPAGRGKDRTGYAIGGEVAGHLWVLDCGSIEGGYSERHLDILCGLAQQHNVHEVYIETNFGMGTFAALMDQRIQGFYLQPGDDPARPDGWQCRVDEDTLRAVGQKEERIIQCLEGPMSQHRIVMAEKAIRVTEGLELEHELQWQIASITPERGSLEHDDAIDALAMLSSLFIDSLHVNPDAMRSKYQQESILERLRKRHAHLGMKPPPRPRWSETLRPIQ